MLLVKAGQVPTPGRLTVRLTVIALKKLELAKSAAQVDVLPYEAIKRVLAVGSVVTGFNVVELGS
jgi:hypothetical protein